MALLDSFYVEYIKCTMCGDATAKFTCLVCKYNCCETCREMHIYEDEYPKAKFEKIRGAFCSECFDYSLDKYFETCACREFKCDSGFYFECMGCSKIYCNDCEDENYYHRIVHKCEDHIFCKCKLPYEVKTEHDAYCNKCYREYNN